MPREHRSNRILSPSRLGLAGLGAALVVSALATSAAAQAVVSPRALGMGNAVRGDPRSNSALILNPAGMSRDYVYAAEFGYHRANGAESNAGVLNVVDSRTQPNLAVGIAYGYEFVDKAAPVNDGGHDVRVGFSTAPSDRVSMGVGLHYLRLNRKDPVEDFDAFTLDAGILMQLTKQINLGLVGHNLAPTDDDAYPTEVGGGVAITDRMFTLDVDVVVNITPPGEEKPKPRIMAGAEFMVQETLPLRVGYERDQLQEVDFVTGGLGFIMSDRGGGGQINIGYRQNLKQTEDFNLMAAITLFL